MELLIILIIIAFVFGDSPSKKSSHTITRSRGFKEYTPHRHPWCSSETNYHGRRGKK